MSWPSSNSLTEAAVIEESQSFSDIQERVTQIQWQLTIKRTIDFIGAAIGLFIFSPVILLTALALKSPLLVRYFFVRNDWDIWGKNSCF